MRAEAELTWDEAKTVADAVVLKKTGSYLTDIEVKVLRGSWDDESYQDIADKHGYSLTYINKDVGNKLWKKLSEALGEEVTKKNFKEALKRVWERRLAKSNTTSLPLPSSQGTRAKRLEFPQGAVPLDSPFYVERSPIESDCYEEILQPGALIRIKAPKQMGKTSLLNRILDRAAKQGYRTARLNLREADGAFFSDLDKFLRWFCANVSLRLEVPHQLDNYWDEAVIGSKVSSKTYFQAYLFQQIDSPLALALDEVDRVFQYPEIAQEFFPMLRSWHEEANNRDIWKQLRLVVVHSTEDYGPLDINQSPFNVGLPVELTEFTLEQVEDLARRHKLDWVVQGGEKGLAPLLALVQGHPYLVRLALHHLATQGVKLEQLLQNAATNAGIYQAHLRRHLDTLIEYPRLAVAFKQVVASNEPVQLETMQEYKLYSMGLIKRQGDRVFPRCELYRQYFRGRLGNEC